MGKYYIKGKRNSARKVHRKSNVLYPCLYTFLFPTKDPIFVFENKIKKTLCVSFYHLKIFQNLVETLSHILF